MAVEGQWRTYSLTLAWNQADETLRLICTFEMEPPEDKLPKLYEALNLPRTTTWRMIKRLQSMEIVDVRKSRRQNIVSIRKKYLKK